MATATKDKAGPRAVTNELVELLSTRRREVLDAAETILMAKVSELIASYGYDEAQRRIRGERAVQTRTMFNQEELAVFDGLAWDRDRLHKEFHRCASILDNQSRAGTTADRQAAAERLAKADEAIRRSTIDEQIAALEQQKGKLEREQREAADVVSTQTVALERLRKMAPAHIREQAEMAAREARRENNDRELNEQLRVARIVTSFKTADEKLNWCRQNKPEFVRQATAGTLLPNNFSNGSGRPIGVVGGMGYSYVVDDAALLEFVLQQKAALPALERADAEQKANRAEAVAHAEKILDLYAR